MIKKAVRQIFEYKAVPCRIRVIKKRFSVLDDPDKRFFGWSWVYIPNPFESYWKNRTFLGQGRK